MFERFTDRARCVMDLAQREAQRRNHEQIGTEHILLAIVKEDRGAGARLLPNLGVDLVGLSEEIEKLTGRGLRPVSTRKLHQTAGAKKAIEYAIEEARAFHHAFVDAEHILLGLLRDREGVPAQVLRNVGVGLEEVRAEAVKLLDAGNRRPLAEQGRLRARCCRGSGETVCTVGYRDLPAWQTADQLARQVYALTAQLPQEGTPGAALRLRDIALSIPPHIAEAHDRRTSDQARWFLDLALGALRELRYLLELAESLEPLQAGDLQGLVTLADEVDRRLREFHTSLPRRWTSSSPIGPIH